MSQNISSNVAVFITIDDAKISIDVNNELIKTIVVAMMMDAQKEHFDHLRKIDHDFDNLTDTIDVIRNSISDDLIRNQLRQLVCEIQLAQNLIDKIISQFKDNDEKITISELVLQVETQKEIISKLNNQIIESDTSYASFSDQLLETYNADLDERIQLLKNMKDKDNEIEKLLSIVNASEVPFSKLEKQVVQTEYLKSENDKMQRNICVMNTKLHTNALKFEKINNDVYRLTESNRLINEKLICKNAEIEKLKAEIERLKNPYNLFK